MTKILAITRSVTFSAILAGSALGFATAANAAADYDGYADFFITLDSVLFQGQGESQPEAGDWTVTSSGVVIDSGTDATGTGIANIDTGIDAARSWSVGDQGLVQFSNSYGSLSGEGLASSFGDTEFEINVVNTSNKRIDFAFSYSAFVSADITASDGEDAGAYGSIELFDDFSSELLFTSAEAFVGGPLADSSDISRDLLFSLEAGASNTIFGNVYSDGYAEKVSEVPLPAAAWLFGSGLIALFGLKRRK